MDSFTLTLIVLVGGFLLFRLFRPGAGTRRGEHGTHGGGCCGGGHAASGPERATSSEAHSGVDGGTRRHVGGCH